MKLSLGVLSQAEDGEIQNRKKNEMKLYTKTGDKRTTSLVGGKRVSKTDPRIEAYGTVDELMAHIGYLHDLSTNPHRDELPKILDCLMKCASLLAAEDQTIEKLPRLTQTDITELEVSIDNLMAGLPELRYFTLPMGHAELSYSHICRTVCRRAERRIAAAYDLHPELPESVAQYINRLSDYLYAFGRNTANLHQVKEFAWDGKE